MIGHASWRHAESGSLTVSALEEMLTRLASPPDGGRECYDQLSRSVDRDTPLC